MFLAKKLRQDPSTEKRIQSSPAISNLPHHQSEESKRDRKRERNRGSIPPQKILSRNSGLRQNSAHSWSVRDRGKKKPDLGWPGTGGSQRGSVGDEGDTVKKLPGENRAPGNPRLPDRRKK